MDYWREQTATVQTAFSKSMKQALILFLELLVWFSSIAAVCADGETTAPEIVNLRVGVEGVYKLGLWTPVWVELRGGTGEASGTIVVTVPDDEGGPCSYVMETVTLPAQATREVEMLVQIGRPRAQATVRWEAEGGPSVEKVFQAGTASFPTAIAARTPVFLWVGPSQPPQALMGRRNEKGHWVWVKNPERLPTHFLGYQSVRTVVLAIGDDKEFIGSLQRSGKQMLALQEWVREGGKVVASFGPTAKMVVSDGGVLSWVAPGTWQNAIPLRKCAGIETYVDSPRPIVVRRSDPPLQALQFTNFEGIVTASEGNIPLVIRRQYGFGTIVFFTTDLTHRALVEWTQFDRLIDRLVGYSVAQDDVAGNPPRTLMHYGYTDVSGQLRSALDVLPTISFVPFSWVAVLVVIYLVIIGPVDYWILGYGIRNYRWTWITFPAIIILAAGAGILLGYSKGERPVTKEVHWIDYDLAGNAIRGLGLGSLYSLRPGFYDISFTAPDFGTKSEVGQLWLGWFGIPGHGLGGMENTTGVLSSLEPYTAMPRSGLLQGFPVNQWSTRSVWALWSAKSQTPPLQLAVFDREGVLRGRIQNNLDVTLENCFVAYGDWVYDLGTLEPGQAWESFLGDDRRELRSWLNGRQVFVEGEGVRAQTRQRVQPYETGSRDVGYILRMMAFYQAAGGFGYVELSHEYWPFFDGSEWLANGRAVMIARVRTERQALPLFGVTARNQTFESVTPVAQECFCRFVLPVPKGPPLAE